MLGSLLDQDAACFERKIRTPDCAVFHMQCLQDFGSLFHIEIYLDVFVC